MNQHYPDTSLTFEFDQEDQARDFVRDLHKLGVITADTHCQQRWRVKVTNRSSALATWSSVVRLAGLSYGRLAVPAAFATAVGRQEIPTPDPPR